MDSATLEKRDKLVEQYLGLAQRIARRWAGSKGPEISEEDLIGPANLGLLNAASEYDESLCDDFMKYASIHIVKEIKSYLRENDHLSRFGRALVNQYQSTEGTLEERAEQIGWNDDEVSYLMSIPEKVISGFGEEEQDEYTRDNTKGTFGDGLPVEYNYDELENIVNTCCRYLKTSSAACFRLRHLNGLSDKEISERMNISLRRVSTRLERAYGLLSSHSLLKAQLGLEPGETSVSK